MSVAHRQIAEPEQQWTTPAALARWLGMRAETVRTWIRRGELPAARVDCRHYSDERVRRTARRRWRIYERDVRRILEDWRSSAKPPAALWRR